ncbi:MAG: hypothetical protein Q8R00_05170 [Candidatus Nanoarchaeia archaeon]|nr:hypothetical protein [Candidatus Nanoarchaeia archaeon]
MEKNKAIYGTHTEEYKDTTRGNMSSEMVEKVIKEFEDFKKKFEKLKKDGK